MPFFFFFFSSRRRHTRLTCDWSSDVCSSDLEGIAKRAGISKRTFYHRFTGKEMLFEAVVRRLIERWTPSFDAALLEGAPLADGLRQAAEHMLNVALTPEALALH